MTTILKKPVIKPPLQKITHFGINFVMSGG